MKNFIAALALIAAAHADKVILFVAAKFVPPFEMTLDLTNLVAMLMGCLRAIIAAVISSRIQLGLATA